VAFGTGKPRRAAAALLLAALAAGGGRAQEAPAGAAPLPLWELGAGLGAAQLPHYRGSDEYHRYVLPFPYLAYRGRMLRADRGGLRGIFVERPRWVTELSFGGSLPVDEDNRAREGMPPLDAAVEAGPALRVFLRPRTADWNLYARPACRAVWAVDLGEPAWAWEGARVLLTVGAYARGVVPAPWRAGVSAGVDGGDRGYHRYYYRVRNEEARPDRPAYDPRAGYGGFHLAWYAARDIAPRLTLGLYARWEHAGGAVYEDSPLVRERDNWLGGAALTWKFWRSARAAAAPDEEEQP